jgi:integrase/recombinase XerD
MKTRVCAVADKVAEKFVATSFKPFLDAFRFDCQIRNLTSRTLDCYFERLGYFFDYLSRRGMSLQQVTRQANQDYVLSLQGSVSDETINGRLRVYRKFFNFLTEEEMWEGQNPMKGVKLLRTARLIKPVVSPEDVQRIIASPNRKTFEGNRNLVMILLLWDGMLRKKELLGLKISDIDLEVHLLKVFGKGRKERMVPMGIKTLKVLHQFLSRWRSKFPGDFLICMRNGEPLTERHCHKIVQQMGQKHDIRLHPHLLRHSAATRYIQQGGNPPVLQRILGHSSLLVTQNYLHLSSADALNSYSQFSPSNSLRF